MCCERWMRELEFYFKKLRPETWLFYKVVLVVNKSNNIYFFTKYILECGKCTLSLFIDFGQFEFSPDRTLLLRVHPGSKITAVSFREFDGVGQWTQDSDWSGGVNTGPDLGLGVLWSHGAAPDLGVVEEEQLVVRHVEARQVWLLPVDLNPLLVCSIRLWWRWEWK